MHWLFAHINTTVNVQKQCRLQLYSGHVTTPIGPLKGQIKQKTLKQTSSSHKPTKLYNDKNYFQSGEQKLKATPLQQTVGTITMSMWVLDTSLLVSLTQKNAQFKARMLSSRRLKEFVAGTTRSTSTHKAAVEDRGQSSSHAKSHWVDPAECSRGRASTSQDSLPTQWAVLETCIICYEPEVKA